MPVPPHDVPADVWIEINKYITVHQDAHNLSLTCSVIRDATLPSLFRILSFDALRHQKAAWQSFLYNSSQRADALLSNPHLLVHVREVHVHFRRSIRGPLWRTTIDKISMIISASPHIQKVSLMKCTITPALHEVICAKSSIQSLELHETGVFPLLRPPPVVGVTTLSYRERSDTSSAWFMQLLDSCLLTLLSLDIDSGRVYRYFFYRTIAGGQPLALRSLVSNVDTPEEGLNLAFMCPQLRTLSAPFLRKCNFPEQALQKLERVEASLSNLTSLIPGRNIHTVNLVHSEPLNMSRDHICLLRAGNVPVRHLSISTPLANSARGIELLFSAFRDLSSLSLTVPFPMAYHPNTDVMLDPVTSSLSQLSQLRIYRIYSPKHINALLLRKYSGFPLAPSGNPSNRGHPSLIEFQFLPNFSWLWFPDKGWTLRQVNEPQYTLEF